MRILNLTQHKATSQQEQEGVIEPRENVKETICELLTFDNIPTQDELESRAHELSYLAAGYDITNANDIYNGSFPDAVMLGGAPFFMSTLERWCEALGLKVLYAFSVRESVEETLEDGSVLKKAVFTHKGFVEVETPKSRY